MVSADTASPEAGTAAAALSVKERTEALMKAIREGKVPEYKRVASTFSSSELKTVQDDLGRSLLHHSAQNGQERICKLLLEDVEVDVNAQDQSGETALALAAAMGAVPAAEYLIKAGAKVNLCRPNGPAPIHRAACCPTTTMIDVLVTAGADVSMHSDTGTPLAWAAGAGKHEHIEVLIKHGSAVNSMAREEGTEPSSSSSKGGAVSPLTLAAANGSLSSVKLLLEHGADASHVGKGGATALHAVAAVDMEDGVAVKMTELLLKAGASPDIADEAGNTPILIAAAREHRKLVHHLLFVSKSLPGVEWSVDGVMAHAKEKFKASEPTAAGTQVLKIPEPQVVDDEKAMKLKRLGDEAFVKKDYPTAIKEYSESLKFATRNHLVWANRAASYLKLEKYEEALNDARIARAITPSYAKAWYREGSAYAGMKKWEDAACAYFEACNLEPKNEELKHAFQSAITEGRKEFQAGQK